MEYPKMDRKLHLLMLMRQLAEEARGLGISEPTLEFRGEDDGLTIWVAGTEAVGEVRYGGVHRADELAEGPGEALGSLEADGYVELDYKKRISERDRHRFHNQGGNRKGQAAPDLRLKQAEIFQNVGDFPTPRASQAHEAVEGQLGGARDYGQEPASLSR